MTAEAPGKDRPLVFVTVGTDHHPFARLIGWIDDWVAGRQDEVECLVQHGASPAPQHARGRPFLTHADLADCLRQASVVVCHGGPSTISEARRHGHVPVVVARRPDLGEHVDDHQVRFTGPLSTHGKVRTVASRLELHDALDEAIAHPDRFAAESGTEAIDDAVARVAALVTELVDDVKTPEGPPDPPVRVLYIGGLGRSGSTLLADLLGQTGGCVSVGEVVHLSTRGLGENNLCGCGTPFLACPFWAEVGRHAFGGWDRVDTALSESLRLSVNRNRWIPAMLMPWAFRSHHRRALRYGEDVRKLYRALTSVSGADVVIDNSKDPAFAYFLRRVPGMQLSVIQIVRASHGVAWSWSKQVRRPEVTDHHAYMHQYSPAHAAQMWTYSNLAFELLRLLKVRVMRVHYEDFVADPRATLLRILTFAGQIASDDDLSFVTGPSVARRPQHTVSGNPARFDPAPIVLRTDDEWKREMSRTTRLTVSALSWPVSLWYGYRGGNIERRFPGRGR